MNSHAPTAQPEEIEIFKTEKLDIDKEYYHTVCSRTEYIRTENGVLTGRYFTTNKPEYIGKCVSQTNCPYGEHTFYTFDNNGRKLKIRDDMINFLIEKVIQE